MTNINHPWFSMIKTNPSAKIRLFCFAYAGGGASIYRKWNTVLPDFLETIAIQLPGREKMIREKALTNIDEIVDQLFSGIDSFLDKDFIFFGHSMGAVISFELTRRLIKEKNKKPLHLYASGRCAPQIKPTSKQIHHLSDSDFIKELSNFEGTPNAALQNKELMALVLPTLKADFKAIETYQYQESSPFDVPISAFGGIQDKEVTESETAAWSAQTTKTFTLRMFEGGHFFIDTSYNEILEEITRDMKDLVL